MHQADLHAMDPHTRSGSETLSAKARDRDDMTVTSDRVTQGKERGNTGKERVPQEMVLHSCPLLCVGVNARG